jgi:hypothetical protein
MSLTFVIFFDWVGTLCFLRGQQTDKKKEDRAISSWQYPDRFGDSYSRYLVLRISGKIGLFLQLPLIIA